ncbi:MAG: uracil-xanthine permease [Clostridia bacterium]|nr:uracil-xanthine permease [Clostridia bacterium]
MKMIYNVEDKPKFGQILVFAFQQLLAILAATILVPVITNNAVNSAIADGKITWQFTNEMDMAAALFGAGVGTLVYQLFTKFKSPVFLGSSFAFLGSLAAAFAGAVSAQAGYAGLIIGAVMAGLVYVVIAIIVKIAGVNWLNKLMPPVVIGPTVAIIGLSLAGNAISDLTKGGLQPEVTDYVLKYAEDGTAFVAETTKYESLASPYVALICGLVTLIVVMVAATYGKKMAKLIPFIIGIAAGYAVAAIFTFIGIKTGNDALKVIDFTPLTSLWVNGVNFNTFVSVPQFSFLEAIKGVKEITPAYLGTLAAAYVPVAFVVFAEHVADHKNISSIIERDLLKEPGLHRTLLGDGVGSMFGAFFGGCPNTTYGESVACVAITRNASSITIITTAIFAMMFAFIAPATGLLRTIPNCVMGGVCMALYGFIAVSGLKMLQPVDLNKNRNLFVASVILIAGIGGLSLSFGNITITTIACALILGIVTNIILSKKKDDDAE